MAIGFKMGEEPPGMPDLMIRGCLLALWEDAKAEGKTVAQIATQFLGMAENALRTMQDTAGGSLQDDSRTGHFAEPDGLAGPKQVARMLQEALRFCWTMLPKDRRNVEHAEKVFRRLLDRAIKDMKEDAEIFGRE